MFGLLVKIMKVGEQTIETDNYNGRIAVTIGT
jgi:hypothetical protein